MFRILGPRGHLIVRAATAARVKKILAALRRRFGKVKVVPIVPAPVEFVMYDSITVSQIPRGARAVAGYVGGMWPTFPQLQHDFPNARHLSVAVSAFEDADCLDVEQGDASPQQAPAWVRRQIARGVKRPAVYCAISSAPTVLACLRRAGIRRGQVRLWTAHYTDRPHRCSPFCRFGMWTRADATQFTPRSLGRNLDASLCAPDFL